MRIRRTIAPTAPTAPSTSIAPIADRFAPLVIWALAACGGAEGPNPDGPPAPAQVAAAPTAVVAPVSESVPPDVLLVLGPGEPFEVTAARPWDARACVSGSRAGLELLVCRYADEAEAEANKKKLGGFLSGAQSGAVARSGDALLAVADKAKVDPKGYEIARLIGAFAPPKAQAAP